MTSEDKNSCAQTIAAPSISVLIVAADVAARRSLAGSLESFDGMHVADECADGSEALRKVLLKPVDIALLELDFKDAGSVELTRQIRKSQPHVRILVSTASDSPSDIFAAMDAGADGYILKSNHSSRLEIAVRSVRLGAVWLDPDIARQVLEVMVTSSMAETTRELQTGLLIMPMLPHEQEILTGVAGSNCVDGVCMIDPGFLKKLKRFAPAAN